MLVIPSNKAEAGIAFRFWRQSQTLVTEV